MEHDDRTYMDDEGLAYVAYEGAGDAGGAADVELDASERLWGADEAWGGYDAE